MSIDYSQVDSILLLGDSITEMGFQPGGFVQRLAVVYQRRLDVVNRGLGGYNTDWLLPIAEKVVSNTLIKGSSKIRLVVIWMGTNDSVLEGMPSGQHVPVSRYKKNLLAMYSLYPSSIPTIFITPTPFRHDIWRDRDPKVTAQYGEAAKDLAKELGVGFVDSQKEFKGKKLEPLLSDGLHLKPAGYEIVFDAFMRLIREKHPELAPERLPCALPSWDDHDMRDAGYKYAMEREAAESSNLSKQE
ncbi:hypothetical protein M407DRAFT_243186 [Tulasnella calospora MUT 4182]|uniref:SGNH hydrolase-type esterase domain-containing protein n=1 Tax=Tulasnella calospora MUT 4182 TaxID=1051891 RepID=A0A0C3QKR6_9AGAM|nr:hypothetical protein M407DRAFT_243186 [Tulasnella calospora MUT 4182]